jgi:hypothetical protein
LGDVQASPLIKFAEPQSVFERTLRTGCLTQLEDQLHRQSPLYKLENSLIGACFFSLKTLDSSSSTHGGSTPTNAGTDGLGLVSLMRLVEHCDRGRFSG